MRLPIQVKLAWSIAQTVFWAAEVMLFGGDITPADGVWFYIQFPARLMFAWWFVSAYRTGQERYNLWREEVLHRKIKPILTEPPEVST